MDASKIRLKCPQDTMIAWSLYASGNLFALAMAETFRDVSEQDVVLVFDNIFCFVQAVLGGPIGFRTYLGGSASTSAH